MRASGSLLRILLLVVISIGHIHWGPGATCLYAQIEDPVFDMFFDLQRFQPQYNTAAIAPQNNANTGAFSQSIAIQVPPGRNGLAPNIALAHSSSGKNGWVGMGWSLDMGYIQRSTKRGLDYGKDDYVFNGSAELVARPDWASHFLARPTFPAT